MILALTVMTIATAIQGFPGAGVTHGIDYLMFRGETHATGTRRPRRMTNYTAPRGRLKRNGVANCAALSIDAIANQSH